MKIFSRPSLNPPITEITLGEGLLTSSFLQEFFYKLERKTILIADERVKDLYAIDLAKLIHAELLTIPTGEKTKSQEKATYLINELFKLGAERESTLVALGGGVTTDLVGFVASIYMRGVPLVLIPTTLLCIVDASIGGKTSIDTPFGKNLIGTFYHPKAIFSDLDTLKTLSEKEWFNGLAEILKMALIYDASIWEHTLKNRKDPTIILKAIQGKIAIIERDPTEQGLRRILNFGHTIGHALETVADYEMDHGEAVALGCIAESYLSMHLGYLSKIDFEQILAMYSHFPLKLPRAYTRIKLFQAMAHDKKKSKGAMRFVLINKIGTVIPFEGAYCRVVFPHELESTLDWMENAYET